MNTPPTSPLKKLEFTSSNDAQEMNQYSDDRDDDDDSMNRNHESDGHGNGGNCVANYFENSELQIFKIMKT